MPILQPRRVEWICTLAACIEPCALSPDALQRLVAICHPLPAERPLRFMWHKLYHLKVKILPDSQPCPGYIAEETESSFLQGVHRAAARPRIQLILALQK